VYYRDDVHSIHSVPVLVTGAGRGIGKRLAIGFALQGARVGLLARSKAELDLCHLEIEHGGGTALRIRADVADYEQVSAAVERMHVHFGAPLQVLVCAAGLQGAIGPFAESNPKNWADVVQTNLTGVMNACRVVLPGMIQRRSGKIIVLIRGTGSQARPNFAAYAASKSAVVSFVESVAEEVRDHNVQINCMIPGASYTHMTDQVLSAGERAGWREIEEAQQVRLTGGVPAGKQSELALFLASEESNHISGRLIHVQDDWKRLRDGSLKPEHFMLRRVHKH
jgi:NAD(P)-dependent dehydrogenase (short-subunit alcohol dehydrogenase family)